MFSIAVIITLSVLLVLDKFLISKLRTIITDGTFDQERSLRRLVNLHKQGKLNGATFYSYGLSAATDRLALAFQEHILSHIFADKFASGWKSWLIDRG